MDLCWILSELRSRKEEVEKSIALFERLQVEDVDGHNQATSIKQRARPDRNSTSAEERQQAAAPMKKYWENRRS